MYIEKLKLNGRIAVVTGGGRGIGAACAQALGEAGAVVIIAEKAPELMETSVAELKKIGIDAHGVTLDIANSKNVDEVASRIAKEYGRVDILVNNAAVNLHNINDNNLRSENLSDKQWRYHMGVNLDGTFWCCRAFGRLMLEQGKGAIVNLGSFSGLVSNKALPQTCYNITKAAIHHMTRSLATEWGARGVRVNAVAPTCIETPLLACVVDPEFLKSWAELTPMGRIGKPDEIASVVHFLASDAASLITGSLVIADGGYTCW